MPEAPITGGAVRAHYGEPSARAKAKQLGPIREYPNRVLCDRPVSGFPLLEEFVTPFG